jgi:hypothetical protein
VRIETALRQAAGDPPDLSDYRRRFPADASVRLSLFAEMVKSKPWTMQTLLDVGGTDGIGVNFLEDTFSSRNTNPTHRLQEQAASRPPPVHRAPVEHTQPEPPQRHVPESQSAPHATWSHLRLKKRGLGKRRWLHCHRHLYVAQNAMKFK